MFVRDDAGTMKLDATDYRLKLYSGPAGQEPTRGLIGSSNSYVKMWVSWHGLQQDLGRYPTGWAESFDYMNIHDGPEIANPLSQARIQRLDRMIKAANNDGIAVTLTVMQSYPTWASDGGTSPHGLGATQRVPRDCTAESPWGHFIAYLVCRYKKGAPLNDPGPRDGNTYGNPYGAWISALEFVNEPNWTHWPQGDELECRVEEMFQAAAAQADYHGWPQTGQYLLGPGVSDEKWDPDEPYDPTRQTDWESFTHTISRDLASWRPQTYVGWSMHNYRDIRDLSGKSFSYDTTRVGRSQTILNVNRWMGSTSNAVWLTECGVTKRPLLATMSLTEAETFQDRRCRINFKKMREQPNVPIWTQHYVFDAPLDQNNQYGLRNGIRNADATWSGTRTCPMYTSWLNDMPPI
jgi:hypothetical protein